MPPQLTPRTLDDYKDACAARGTFHAERQDCVAHRVAYFAAFAVLTAATMAVMYATNRLNFWVWGGVLVVGGFTIHGVLSAIYAGRDEYIDLSREGVGIWSKGVAAFLPWQDFAEFSCYRRERSYRPADYDLEIYFAHDAPAALKDAFHSVKKRHVRVYGRNLNKLVPPLSAFCRFQERADRG